MKTLRPSGHQWDREAVMKAAQAAADEAGDDVEPGAVVDPVDYYDNLPSSNADEK